MRSGIRAIANSPAAGEQQYQGQSASLDRLEECPAIPQSFDPIFPATTLGVLLFSFLAGISPVLRVGDHEDQICMWRHKVLQSVAIVSSSCSKSMQETIRTG